MRKGYKWELLLLLWLSFFLNQADRQLFSVVLPLIRKELGLSDGDLGLIASALVWIYGLLVPLSGFMGDRHSRKLIIGTCLLCWSIGTLFTGMASTVVQFVLLRGLVTGGAEAFYAPSANALLSEEHAGNRSLALSIHQTAVYAGIILSGIIAGRIAENYGWRTAFYVFGGAGIVVAGLVFSRLRRDRPAAAVVRVDWLAAARAIGGKPTAILLTLAFACMIFVNVAYLTWMPSLMVEKFGLSLGAAGFSSMFYHHIGAFFGVLLGGSMADRLSRRNRRNRLLVQALALLAGGPFIYFMGQASTLTGTCVALFFFGVFRGAYDSNIFASLYEVIRPQLRSTASGLMLMCAFLAGAGSPWLLGVLKPSLGLSAGLSGLWVSYALGALAIGVAAVRFFVRDATQVFIEDLRFPEGPAFAPDGSLWAVELHGGGLLRWYHGEVQKIAVGGAPNGIAIDGVGRVWFCDAAERTIRCYDPVAREVIVAAGFVDGLALNKPNDLAFDRLGNLLFTCPGDSRTEPTGYAAVLLRDGTVRKFTDSKYFPNGLAFTPDGRYLVVAETYRHRLWKGEWDAEAGLWVDAKPWCDTGGPDGPGGPDGICFDSQGNCYVAVFGTGKIKKISPDGRIVREIPIPGERPTNCAFDPAGKLGLVVTEAEKGQIISVPIAGPGAKLFTTGIQ